MFGDSVRRLGGFSTLDWILAVMPPGLELAQSFHWEWLPLPTRETYQGKFGKLDALELRAARAQIRLASSCAERWNAS
jgi:hypothetical protein